MLPKKLTYGFFLILFYCGLLSAGSFAAQDQPPLTEENSKSGAIESDLFKEFEAQYKQKEAGKNLADSSYKKLIDLQNTLLEEEIKYNLEVYHHRRNVFNWQYISSIIIFWVVIIIVFVGLFFSGIQFYISLKRIKKGEPEKNLAPAKTEPEHSDDTETTFEASLKGIKIRSSVLGLVILVISLAFFYLYLTIVYPVKEFVEPVVQRDVHTENTNTNSTEGIPINPAK